MPIYHLELRGALHVGEAISIDRETVLEWVPSDSLFAAFVSVWAQEGADLKARLDSFKQGEPPFSLSSAFPWVGGVRFYPAPASLPESLGLIGKDAKRVQWMSCTVFEQLCAGDTPEKWFLHDGQVWVTLDEYARFGKQYMNHEGKVRLWQSFVVPRVTVDRAANASNLFHAGRVSFARGDGLWFAARGAHTTWITDALAQLADSGLGGLRNYGHGAFERIATDDDLPGAPLTGAGVSLARYAPSDESEIRATLQQDGAAYRLVTIGGWCADDAGHAWRRRMVRMVAEGAIVPNVTAARGKLVEVRPEGIPEFQTRSVYRYGIPFFVPAGGFGKGAQI
ncbi:MAG: type III-A CRISPR-associated RAMP protein Csm4 [Anaerolineae bacterium]|nr:type III-A CRISPR-associated RAMP protein Csm4 [Anaerolineae bacterium]